jgi:hypothetical protein
MLEHLGEERATVSRSSAGLRTGKRPRRRGAVPRIALAPPRHAAQNRVAERGLAVRRDGIEQGD